MRPRLPVFVLLTTSLALVARPAHAQVGEGRPAPAFQLENVRGAQVSLASFRGRVVIAVFGNGREAGEACRVWGEALRRAFAGEPRLVVLGVAAVHKPFWITRARVREGVRRRNDAPPDTMLLDWGGDVADRYGADGDDLPHLFVIDAEGVVRAQIVGPRGEASEARALAVARSLLAR